MPPLCSNPTLTLRTADRGSFQTCIRSLYPPVDHPLPPPHTPKPSSDTRVKARPSPASEDVRLCLSPPDPCPLLQHTGFLLFLEHTSCVLTHGPCRLREDAVPSAVCMVGFPSFTPGVHFSGAPALPWLPVAVSLPASHRQPGFLWFVSSPLCGHGRSPGRRRLLSRGLPYALAGVSSAHTRGPVRNAFSSRSWGASPRGPQAALRHCLGLWRRGRQAQP